MDWILAGIPFGIAMLYFGSEWMVKGAKGLALRLGVTPLVIGLTVVAFGTSSPEFVTSLVSGDTPEIIIGNMVGSNIANVCLALGLTASVAAISTDFASMKAEAVAFLVSVASICLVSVDGFIGTADGVVLLMALVVFLVLVYRRRKIGVEAYDMDEDRGDRLGYPVLTLLIVMGALLLYFGARFFVDGARCLAETIGVSDMFIGLLVVALGTCLPETCISVVAARRGAADMAVANIFGSVIFNSFFALAAGAILTDIPISDSMLMFHMPVMLAMAAVMFLMVRFWKVIPRAAGPVLVAVYVGYLAVMAAFPSLTI